MVESATRYTPARAANLLAEARKLKTSGATRVDILEAFKLLVLADPALAVWTRDLLAVVLDELAPDGVRPSFFPGLQTPRWDR